MTRSLAFGIMQRMNRTIGIDVGTATTGWAVLQTNPAKLNGLELLGYGAILTPAGSPMPSRLNQIFLDLQELIAKYQPEMMAVESLFFFKNQTTVMTVSQGRGVILLAGERSGLQISEYTPLQVKSAVTGYGRAEKRQVQEMVKSILGLKEIPKPDDAADAIGICITHLSSINYLNKVKKSA